NYDVSKISVKYYKGTKDFPLGDEELPCDAGKYIVVFSLTTDDANNYKIKSGCEELEFTIAKAQIVAKWVNGENNVPMLSGLDDTLKGIVGYVYYDEEGNPLEEGATLEAGKSYKVKAIFLGDNAKNYEFVTEDGQATPNESAETEKQDFTISASNNGGNLGGVTGEELPKDSFDIVGFLKEYWQPIVTVVSIIFILIFMSKGIGYAGKRKKIKKSIDKKFSNAYYAVGGVGLFNLPYTTWTIIASIMAGVAVLSFIFMLLEKRMLSKAEDEFEEAKDEFERNQKDFDNRRRGEENQRRDEQMQMMLMGMLGGNANGGNGGQGFAYMPQGLGADDIRGIVADTMNNMLPNVTQYLPQEASHNDELIQQLVEQNAQNEERIKHLTEQNEQMMERMMSKFAEQQKETVNEEVIEKLAEKLAKQQAVEKEAEKEAAATIVNDEAIENLNKSMIELKEIVAQMAIANAKNGSVEKADGKNDEQIDALVKANESLMRNQEMLMKQIVELSNKGSEKSSPIVMPIMPQPTVVQQPVMPQPIYQQPMYQQPVIQPPVEKVVERIVEKPVPMPVAKAEPKAKTPAPRLTLDEAYAKLSATQKKIFDTLKAYAMSKDKCKEKKSTYFTVLGQSTVNPLVKLTIKKNTTVALFKMEDEYMKDIRRGASSDGTKVKVKETEVVVGDNQALATAKDMIDLREDQIERYNDYLKEQRSMKKK
ncbi:MAG: hypothetical protein HDT32_02735, partial [Clostridiales bacterium]|nr:hypothetical protein [Clostridiales bacterium]